MSYINNEFYYSTENQERAKQALRNISECIPVGENDNATVICLGAYLLYHASKYNNPFGITLDSFLDGKTEISEDGRCLTREYCAKDIFTDEVWKKLLQLVLKYTTDELGLAVLVSERYYGIKREMPTPDSILSLVHKILDVKPHEQVADVCCGSGAYLVSAALKENEAVFHGYEINIRQQVKALLKSELINADISVKACDAFYLVEDEEKRTYDKIFANYPLGMKLKNVNAGPEFTERLSARFPKISKATSADWIFNALLCDLLKDEGKAVGIMTNGSTLNSIDLPMRKYFIEQNLVECIISLPSRMFLNTNIPTTMIVFGKGNEGVRMIDATNLCQEGRRLNEFSEENLDKIMEAMEMDTEYSKVISKEELRQNEYVLSLSRYVNEGFKFKNGVPFETVIKSITRGVQIKASLLDEMVSDEVTDMQYLMLSNINNGMIDEELPYLSEIAPKYEKYCLKNNSLILSKNGPYKIAVAKVAENQKILANGNLYIIELEEQKVNPYYLKAFFDTTKGKAVLDNISVGAVVSNIGVEKLKQIEIPLPDMEKQNEIAMNYQIALDKIEALKLKLNRLIDELPNIFEGECE